MSMPPEKFERIVKGKRYSDKNSTLLAFGTTWDFETEGTTPTALYITKKGVYFTVQENIDNSFEDPLLEIESEDVERAWKIYQGLENQVVNYQAAFPGHVVEDA
jgi:hypothetical protein